MGGAAQEYQAVSGIPASASWRNGTSRGGEKILYRRNVKWITFTERNRRNVTIPSPSTEPASSFRVTRPTIRRTSTVCSATEPLYTLGSHCGGNFVYLDSGVKDCSNCLVPHGRGSYSYVVKKFPELMELAKKNR